MLFTERYRNSSLLWHGFSYYALVRYTGSENDASQTDIRSNNDDFAEPSLPRPLVIANYANFILGLRLIYSTPRSCTLLFKPAMGCFFKYKILKRFCFILSLNFL